MQLSVFISGERQTHHWFQLNSRMPNKLQYFSLKADGFTFRGPSWWVWKCTLAVPLHPHFGPQLLAISHNERAAISNEAANNNATWWCFQRWPEARAKARAKFETETETETKREHEQASWSRIMLSNLTWLFREQRHLPTNDSAKASQKFNLLSLSFPQIYLYFLLFLPTHSTAPQDSCLFVNF